MVAVRRLGEVAGQRLRVSIGAFGVGLAALAAPVAAADPGAPADPVAAPAPAPVLLVPGPAPVTDAALAPAPAPAAPVPSGPAPAAPADPAAAVTPPNGVQHLPSPDALPPGTTKQAQESPTTGLLRDIWHALRDGEMTGPDALKLLAATRPVDPEKLAQSKPSDVPVASAAPAAAPDPAAPAAPAAAPDPAAPVLVPAPVAPVPPPAS